MAGEGRHKEINRTNMTMDNVYERIKWKVVQTQIEMLHMRNTFPAFSPYADIYIESNNNKLKI